MTTAKRHYDELLGSVYAWSVAASGDPFERGQRWLREHALMDAERYLDLGAGFGAHVLPLLRAGKQVTAVDFNTELLGQLTAVAGETPGLTIEETDLVGFLEQGTAAEWDVILCLGDTLTHLDSTLLVKRFLAGAARRLNAEGRLALAYRDSSAFRAEGVARFIPVASDGTRVMHCLLEPIDASYLRVTDIVTEVTAEGPRTRLSEYHKLRLPRATLVEWAGEVGLALVSERVEQGMTSLIFRRLFA